LKNFFNSGSIARLLAFAGKSRQKAFRRGRARFVALVLVVAMFANCLGQDGAAELRRNDQSVQFGGNGKTTLVVVGLIGAVAVIGVGVFAAIQHHHTVKGCVSDNPDGLQLRTEDGKTFVLLGATTKIRGDEKIKVTGTKKKKIDGVTDQPSFVVEKLNKVYGSCTVAPTVAPTVP